MAITSDQNAQQVTTSQKKVWQKPEVYLLDSAVNGGAQPGPNEKSFVKSTATPGGYAIHYNPAHPSWFGGGYQHKITFYNS